MKLSGKPPLARSSPARFVLVIALLAWLGAPECARTAEAAEPIRFARGTSSAKVQGAVIRGERALYSFEARAGQWLSLRITALEDNAVFQVYAPGARTETRDSLTEIVGKTLPGAGEGDNVTRWAGTLPHSGAYLLVVGATRGNATYRLTITIR